MPGEKILLVEDEAVCAAHVKRLLEKLGYTICAVLQTGEEAVKEVEALKPDCVLMDIGLSKEMDGIEAARKIKENFAVPVIFLTSMTGGNIMKKADEASHYGYLIKPVHPDHLSLTIKSAIQRSRLEAGSYKST